MGTLIRTLILLPALSLGACGGGDDDALAFPAGGPGGQEYLIGFGETIHVGSLALEFTTLAEEGRCPINATCTWGGNARILVTVTRGRSAEVLELNTYPGYQVSATFEGYRVELRRLQPDVPWEPRGPLDDYIATVFVERTSN